ncbi:ty3-gypsy retrotransposon protein, partial [Tanacetum coccineum]
RQGGPEDAAFYALKDRLTHAPILCLPDFEDTFVIEADASAMGIRAVLLQNGRLLGYFSRKLGPRMRVAATYQKELFAIVEAVYKWRQYLVGRRFTIRTDHRSIKELMQQVIQTPLQQKYVRKLMGFDFDIEYKMGASNLVADALSRVFEEDDEIHRRMDQGETLDDFHREHGLLLFRQRYFLGVESKLKEGLLAEFHSTPSAGHGGVKKMLVGLATLFYWKGMRRSIEEFIKKCLNLFAARNRMEMQANRSRREVEFNVGDKVLVKLQPYRQIILARRLSNKLAKRYYGPFMILERVSKVSYRLGLPPTSKIHPVFHVSLLKPFIREGIVGVTNLPKEDYEGQPVDQPLAMCATRDILRNGESSRQILVQ